MNIIQWGIAKLFYIFWWSSVASNYTKWFSIMGFTKYYLFDESNDHFLICELKRIYLEDFYRGLDHVYFCLATFWEILLSSSGKVDWSFSTIYSFEKILNHFICILFICIFSSLKINMGKNARYVWLICCYVYYIRPCWLNFEA